MKVLFLIPLLAHSLCEVLFLEKYSETISLSTSGCICLPISEFEIDDSINLKFSAEEGNVNDYIHYGYSNNDDPTEATCDEIAVNKEEASERGSLVVSTTTETTKTLYYYYYIDKKKDDKYMLIKYDDFMGRYLLIENIRFRTNYVILIPVTIFSIIAFIIVIICVCKYKEQLKLLIPLFMIFQKKEKVTSDDIETPIGSDFLLTKKE